MGEGMTGRPLSTLVSKIPSSCLSYQPGLLQPSECGKQSHALLEMESRAALRRRADRLSGIYLCKAYQEAGSGLRSKDPHF